jgi:hypothetical protein
LKRGQKAKVLAPTSIRLDMAFDKKNPPKKSAISFPARMVNSKASGFFRIAKDFFSDKFSIDISKLNSREGKDGCFTAIKAKGC